MPEEQVISPVENKHEKLLTETMTSEEFREVRRAQRSKGGVQARIDNLVKEKRALEARVAPANIAETVITPAQSPLPASPNGSRCTLRISR